MPTQPSKKAAGKTTRAAAVKKTAVKKTATRKAAPTKTATKKAAVKKVARKRAAKREPIVTTVIAKLDAGFGNHLYIRGNSSGLTWDAGVLMENTGSDEWIWKSAAVTSELEFKVLVNDKTWASGPNGVVFPGATVVFEPSF
ncbi:MAG: hypothetical protein ACP5I4_03805 [Oceanipulchritudo sp.]